MSTDSRQGQVVIRAMSLDERAIWEELWTGYLDFYNTKISQETKSVTWARLHTKTANRKRGNLPSQGGIVKNPGRETL